MTKPGDVFSVYVGKKSTSTPTVPAGMPSMASRRRTSRNRCWAVSTTRSSPRGSRGGYAACDPKSYGSRMRQGTVMTLGSPG